MIRLKQIVLAAGMGLSWMVPPVVAETVSVDVRGTVEYNQLTFGPFRNAIVHAGDPVVVSFLVDSTNYLNSPQHPVRGYRIDKPSFLIQIGAASAGLPVPFPNGVTPYFSIRNNDPGLDGFLITNVVDNFGSVPINGYQFPNFGLAFLRTFSNGNIWPTVDILDAIGSYGFENMSSYDFRVLGLADSAPLGIMYESIELSLTCLKGDMNSDQSRDMNDVAGFVDALLADELDSDLTCRADVNADGVADGDDIASFTQCVTGAACP